MQPFFEHSHLALYVGDVLDVLAELPDASVQCCVTSPPYFGLRDYGTAEWEGGSAECDHKAPPVGGPNPERYTPGGGEMWRQANDKHYSSDCPKCGARRIDRQIGLEPTIEAYVAKMVEVFRAVRRVLRDDGTLFLNLGDSYSGSGEGGGGNRKGNEHGQHDTMIGKRGDSGLKPKDLCGVPWRVAFALQADGWWLRSDIIWSKCNPMPESVTDRPTKSHEYIFMLTKSARYYYDAEAIREPHQTPNGMGWAANGKGTIRHYGHGISDARRGTDESWSGSGLSSMGGNPAGRNRRTVWTIATEPFPEAHFATYPQALVEPCIQAGTSERGCCPQCGAPWQRVVEKSGGTTGKGWTDHKADMSKGMTQARYSGGLAGEAARNAYRVECAGWQPTCACGSDDTTPCVVLDPFGGSGTTALVANRLGRKAILIELNRDYAEMAARRLQQGVLV